MSLVSCKTIGLSLIAWLREASDDQKERLLEVLGCKSGELPTFTRSSTIRPSGSNPYQFHVRVSGAEDNALSVTDEGLFVQVMKTVAGDSASVTIVGDGSTEHPLTAEVAVNPSADNALTVTDQGLFVDLSSIRQEIADLFQGSKTVAVIDGVAEVIISPREDNVLTVTEKGLFVAAPEEEPSHLNGSNTIEVTGEGGEADPYVIKAIIDPSPENELEETPEGLKVVHECRAKFASGLAPATGETVLMGSDGTISVDGLGEGDRFEVVNTSSDPVQAGIGGRTVLIPGNSAAAALKLPSGQWLVIGAEDA